jgi:hypothetical protein
LQDRKELNGVRRQSPKVVDIPSIAGSLGAIKSAYDIVKGIKDVHDINIVQASISDLQKKILEAQEAALNARAEQLELIEEKRVLNEKLRALEDWQAEKQRYVLEELAPGTFAYTRRTDAVPKEPLHQICASCYNHGQKSILQHEMRAPGRSNVFVCSSCDAAIYVSGMRFPEHGHGKPKK